MKTSSAVVIGLLLIFGLFLPNFSLAQGTIANAFLGVFNVLFGLISNVLGTITGTFLAMAVGIFNWVASPNFISLSYTQLDNPFIKIGWTLTRDLTNIFFVLALVVIGLGTALRLTDYQAQKALPTLIIIALLINFTPVILGLIVDASNIVMNFFIQGGFAGANSFTNFAFSQWGNVSSLVGGLKFWDPMASNEAKAAAAGSFVLIFFNLIAALVYLLFALIFILRYVAIWTLVILSPFAFACYILPATKKVWSQWWNQFIQWSLIGVIAAFFLYLGDHFIKIATSQDFLKDSMTEIGNAPGLAPIINSVLPYFISIIFLFIGLTSSLTGTPSAAQGILKAGEKYGKLAANAGWAKTRTLAREKTPSWMRGAGEKMAAARTPKPGWGVGQRGAGAWFKRRGADIMSGAIGPVYGTLRTTGRVMGPGVAEARGKAIGVAEAEAEKFSSAGLLLSKVRGELAPGGSIDKAMGLAAGGIKKGSVFKKVLQDNLTDAEKARLGLEANKLGAGQVAERLGRGFVNQAGRMSFKPLDAEDRAKGYTNITEKLIGEATKDEIKDFAKNFWTSPESMTAIQKFWGGPQLGKAADEFGRKFVDDYMSVTGRLSANQLTTLNPKAALYLSGNVAQDLGFRSPEGLSAEEIRRRVTGGPAPTRPTAPPGVPPNWVPGPGGTWIPPTP